MNGKDKKEHVTKLYGFACAVFNEKDEILLLKRSPNKEIFPNKWGVVAAGPFIEKPKDLTTIAAKEIKDEIGVTPDKVSKGKTIATNIGKDQWDISSHVAVIESSSVIQLNDEHVEHQWVKKENVKNYDLAPGVLEALEEFAGS